MNRLADIKSLQRLQNYLGYHLGEQHHHLIDADDALRCSEAGRMSFLPQVFGLIPVNAIIERPPYGSVKPLIAEHLASLGVPRSELLVNIVKDLCDNFDRTRIRDGDPRLRVRKSSIADLRQAPDLYRKLRTSQGARCRVCGTEFSEGKKEETLDHVIPWRLGGDPPGGWNWQLLCRRCNSAKDTIFSAFATPEYVNWIYSDLMLRAPSADSVSERGRYLVLKHYGRCQTRDCTASPSNSELWVVRSVPSGLPVFDHLTVACDRHRTGPWSGH